ncbi:MBL fold metallo-hydrolase [Hominifimenecus sp. rT4P-3]|uniref:MBL fold metallo-hydrolase n=1 Tax=Hominifimenecus sp. rT4P-3 TaxID=3242979 RepID=UPI003DA3D2DE
MYERMKAGERTYWISCPSRMGIYQISDREVCLIDSGNDKDAGKKVQKILAEQGWELKMIFNTHSHADHIGGNQLLQQRLGCKIYAPGTETAFVRYPELEPSFLYGGYPIKEHRNKFLLAKESLVEELTPEVLPEGLEMILLPGHSFSMAGFHTSDDVWFLADSLTSEEVLEKYHVSFLYDVQAYLDSLDRVENLSGKLFIPSHAEPVSDIRPLVQKNREKVLEVAAFVRDFCREPKSTEEVVQAVFYQYQLKMDAVQYVLIGSTIRSYLAYWREKQELFPMFEENRWLWTWEKE